MMNSRVPKHASPGRMALPSMQRSISAPNLSKAYLVNKYFTDVQKNFKRPTIPPVGVDIRSVQLTPGQEVIYGGSKVNLQTRKPAASLWNSMSSVNQYSQIDDLVHLPGPTTEDALLRTLQARFYTAYYYTFVGPVLLAINPNNQEQCPDVLGKSLAINQKLVKFLDHTLQKLKDSGLPQSVVLSGKTGSGKSFNTALLLRQLFVRTNGLDSGMFRYINAAMTVLQRLTSAQSQHCDNSSRMSYFLEFQMKEDIICKTKMHCFFIDHCRVTASKDRDSNFHIFYQMLAGLTVEEREQYHLDGYGVNNLTYLSGSQQHTALDRRKLVESFNIWKASLAVLGIPLGDIIKILATVLLLGNISFEDTSSLQLKVLGEKELHAVCTLLQVSVRSLYKGLTSKACQSRGQIYTTSLDASRANRRLELLVQSLYSRTVAAIVKRSNHTHRSLSSQSSRSSADSNSESLSSSFPGRGGGILSNGSSHKRVSSTASHNSVHMHTKQLANDTFLGVLDMYGFENIQDNSLEQICINLSSETLQHFYNTFVFKTTEESYIEEGIQADMDIHYHENAPIVELLSSQKTGILSLLEAESVLHNGSADTYMQKVRIQHSKDQHFQECSSHTCSFIVKHFAGTVVYKTDTMIARNKQLIPDDMVWLFSKTNCGFGFTTHLFSQELRQIQDSGGHPKGTNYRLTSHYNLYPDVSLERSRTCASQDFHLHLDTILKTLVQTQPHFVCCIQSNSDQKSTVFEREHVLQQVRSYEILETVHLMISGFPHRMRYKLFNTRYRILNPELSKHKYKLSGENSYTESKQILEMLNTKEDQSYINTQWALGKRNIFLSESVSQLLESSREEKRKQSALVIQTAWRRHRYVTAWPMLKRQLELLKRHSGRGRKKLASVQPRSRTLSAGHIPQSTSVDKRVLRGSYNDLRFDKAKPPDLPMRRSYTIQGNRKVSYPQIRVMTENFNEPGKFSLSEGQEIKVVGASHRSGYLDVEINSSVIAVPFQLTQLYTKKNKMIANV